MLSHRFQMLLLLGLALSVIHLAVVYTHPEFLGLIPIEPLHAQTGRGIPGRAGRQERVIEKDGRRWLWGGQAESQHFDITKFQLNPDQLQYGLGREIFPALIEPQFVPAASAAGLTDNARVLVVKIGAEVKVYPVDLLTRHEVVNDVVGGRPIFAAYCILADLGAVYDRRIGEHTYTFGVSGYTYGDPNVWDGRQAFVLWDRDTESLWWPLLGEAVSGPAIDTALPVLDGELWAQTTWGEVKHRFPNAEVLKPGQDLKRPGSWPRHQPAALTNAPTTYPVAPRWGKNRQLP